MWVEGGDIQDELLDQLGSVLAPPEDLALTPSAAELEALAAAVATRWPDGAAAPASEDAAGSSGATPGLPGSPVRPLRSGGRRPLQRLGSSAWRAGSVAAGIVLVSASAAAAAGGVPLPRPVRVVAYTVGLPVDSPALDDTNQHIKELKEAAKAQDKPKAKATVQRLLHRDLPKVPADEKEEAKRKIEAVINQPDVAPLIQISPSTTTTTMPPPSTTTATEPPSSTTVTTAEEKVEKERERDRDKPAATATTTTTAPPTTTTTEPPTTDTTAPQTDGTPSAEDGTGTGGDGGSIGPGPGPTTSTTAPPDTTATTAPPPPEETTTTTTTTEPPTTTTTTSPPTQPATVEGGTSQQGPTVSATAQRQRRS